MVGFDKVRDCAAARTKKLEAERNGIKKYELDNGPQSRDEWCCKAKNSSKDLKESRVGANNGPL